jgi:ferric-dicitrate binding protein FerR (iron transport regulator)
MHKIQSLLKKMWQGRLSGHEAGQLDGLLKRQHEDFKKTLSLSFTEAIGPGEAPLKDSMAEEILNRLLIKIERLEGRKAKVRSFTRRSLGWAAACALLGLAVFQLFRATKKTIPLNHNISLGNRDTVLQKEMANLTAVDLEMLLPDRSFVRLSPSGKLSYYELSRTHTRNVKLEGKALFKVAKDGNKPFTVFANDFATTALGTQFTVNTSNKNKMEVKLYEGKVVIRASRPLQSLNAVYLVPGQSFTADIPAKQYVVAAFLPEKRLPGPQHKNNPLITDLDQELKFDNAPLAAVFDKLANRYHAKIKYTQNQLEGLYFTGSVLKSDSLKAILSIISNMNRLTFQEENDSILIQKQK